MLRVYEVGALLLKRAFLLVAVAGRQLSLAGWRLAVGLALTGLALLWLDAPAAAMAR